MSNASYQQLPPDEPCSTVDTEFKRTYVDELSFHGQRLLSGRHRMHPYPAMLHPLLIQKLLSDYRTPQDIVFDPFCGSGSVLLTAAKNSHHAIGFDINPLALLIAKAKTTSYDPDLLHHETLDLKHQLQASSTIDIPPIKNIDYWYGPSVVEGLGKIRGVLLANSYVYRELYTVCFAYICRKLSFARNQEFKRYRRPDVSQHAASGEVIEVFLSHLDEVCLNLDDGHNGEPKCDLYLVNAQKPFKSRLKYDFVISSPPYGDHRTTVAYGQYCSFGNEWSRGLNPFNSINYQVDAEGLGKRTASHPWLVKCQILQTTLDRIDRQKQERALDVENYFNGYFSVLQNVASNLNRHGRICMVVGNRHVAGVEIPLDQITAWMLTQLGLGFQDIFVRNISNKVMPLQNSPSNIAGRRGKTMTQEYIVVFVGS